MARVRTIRHRVVAGAVALFVAVWLLIAITLVSGHDPALAKRSTDKATSTASAAPTASGGSAATTTAASTPTSTPSSVTTRQS
jgi:cytoskeletal protein RodZ